MGNKVMTSIYLNPSQKRALARRAKQRKTTMSEEIRSALDRYIEGRNGVDDAQLTLLAGEASRAMDRMIQKLDEAHTSFTGLRRTLSRRKS